MSSLSNVCESLHRLAWGQGRFSYRFDADVLPADGLYLFFEEGERAHGGDRIVRVGSHTGAGQLPSRMRQHFVDERKDRSIFRKNIGRALLRRTEDPYADPWEADLTSRAARENPPPGFDPDRQAAIEREVSEHIRTKLTFVALPLDDPAARKELEKKIASLLFACPECRPSADWLGLHSPKELIRESGLWQVNGLKGEPLAEGEVVELAR